MVTQQNDGVIGGGINLPTTQAFSVIPILTPISIQK